jgi:hypothetical protein
MGKSVKDYKRIRQQVARASELMAGGMSESKAAQKVGLPRSSLQRYMKGKLPADSAESSSPGCPHDEEGEKRTTQTPDGLPTTASFGRDLQTGQFLPGHPDFVNRPARKARLKLEEFCPKVAERLVKIFEGLPNDRPDLILAYAKEILDRSLGKPKQTIDVHEERIYEEYHFAEQLITAADESALRLAVDLAQRMEEHARNLCREAQPGFVEIIPPPGGALHNLGLGSSRQVSSSDNLHATATRKE